MKDSTMSNNISALGFNGEYLDDTLNNYHLGNGYRAYNPTIMQFTAPDDMSPFGHGGINPYVYCSGDPINNSDPTGHFLGIAAMLLMVLPVTFPKELTFKGMVEAAGESIENTIINEGVNTITEVFTAGGATLTIPAIDVVLATVEKTAEHAVVSETGHIATQQVAPSIEHLASEAGPSRVRSSEERILDILNQIPVQHDAPGAIKSAEEDDFTHLISHNPNKGRVGQPALERARVALRKATAEGRVLRKGNNLFSAFRLTDFEGVKSVHYLQINTFSFTNLKRYDPTPEHLDHFLKTTNDKIFEEKNRIVRDHSVKGSFQYKPRSLYEGYLFYSASKPT